MKTKPKKIKELAKEPCKKCSKKLTLGTIYCPFCGVTNPVKYEETNLEERIDKEAEDLVDFLKAHFELMRWLRVRDIIKDTIKQEKLELLEEIKEGCMANIGIGNNGSPYSEGWYKAMDFVEARLTRFKSQLQEEK